MANEDLAAIRTRLESWATRVPSEAHAFHQKRNELIGLIRSITGSFQRRDPAASAEIVRRATELEGILPILEELAATVKQARNEISEFQAVSLPDGPVRDQVRDWSSRHLDLMNLLLGITLEANKARPAIAQAKQIETWTVDRKQALGYLAEAGALRDRARQAELKNEIAAALQDWQATFCLDRINRKWLAEVEASLAAFEQRAAGGTPAPAPRKALEAEPPRAAAPPVVEPAPVQAPPPQPEESPELQFFHMNQALAECRDLADALDYAGSEIAGFTTRQWQLRNQAEIRPGEARSLSEEIRVFHESLQKRAGQERERRLAQLERRWKWFHPLYDSKEIAQLVEQAKAAQPDAANGLREFFDLVNGAEERVYAIVNSNRPKLAGFVVQLANTCRAQVEDLRQQARLTAVDTELAAIAKRIPENPGSQVDAAESFDRLEKCNELERALKELRERNARRQTEVLAKVRQLQELAAGIAAVSDATEVAAIARRIPNELPAARPLDETAAELGAIEQGLAALRRKLRDQKAAELGTLQKENLAWVRLLAEFAPELGTAIQNEAPPEDLVALGSALQLQQEYKQRIAELASKAALQLATRKEQVGQSLRGHLETPAFETHPERESAVDLLQDLVSLAALPVAPRRDEFNKVYQTVGECEDFIDRIESARRAIPERLRILEERFATLREWNGIDFRPELARRTNALLMGTQKAIRLEQWESLEYQLAQADAWLTALHRDALSRISAQMDDLVEQLKTAEKTSKDKVYAHQIENALKDLEKEGHLEPPSNPTRQRLNRLLNRRNVGAAEIRVP